MVLDRLLDVLGLFACFWCISNLLGLVFAWYGRSRDRCLLRKWREWDGWVDG
jgi:hypothetical protein